MIVDLGLFSVRVIESDSEIICTDIKLVTTCVLHG